MEKSTFIGNLSRFHIFRYQPFLPRFRFRSRSFFLVILARLISIYDHRHRGTFRVIARTMSYRGQDCPAVSDRDLRDRRKFTLATFCLQLLSCHYYLSRFFPKITCSKSSNCVSIFFSFVWSQKCIFSFSVKDQRVLS